MHESVITSSIKTTSNKCSDWYRAMTLAERLLSLRSQSFPLSSAPALDDTARQRLQCWKKQPPFDKKDYFLRRLALDGLSEDELASLLALSPDILATHTSPLPWMTILQEAFANKSSQAFLFPQGAGPAEPFLVPFKPLLQRYIERFQEGIQQLAETFAPLPFDPDEMVSLFFAHIPNRILLKVMRTFVLELNVARVQGRLQGETPEDRFRYFLSLISKPQEILALLREYAVLARVLVETLEQWLLAALELCERLCRDWLEICALFPHAREAGPLLEIQADKGDMHRGGRCVFILVWRSGFRLVYKPRSLATDLHFQEVLVWLNICGFQPGFRTLRMIDKGTYGWSEWVEARPASSREEVARFYQRQGGYLALLYGLEAIDLHSENLIASGEHPILIDLEALLQPRKELPDQDRGYSAGRAMEHSVLRVGLLPQRSWSNEQAAGLDLSGMGAQSKQRSPMLLPVWAGAGTDQMRIDEDYAELTLGAHRPTIDGQDVDTQEFCQDVMTGFSRVYRLLIQHRSQLLEEILPRFEHDEIRCVLRRTHTYAKILSDSFHPDVLRDALDRDCMLDRLWVSVEWWPHLEQILPAERADLLGGDIPIFSSTPSSHDLFTSQGERIPGFFEIPAITMVQKRLNELSEQDMEKQLWIIQASFTSMTLGIESQTDFSVCLQSATQPATPERLLTAARAVGDRLEQLALYHEEYVGWLGVELVHEREWHLLPAGINLHGGLSGITFFLAYLGALTQEERYTVLARRALTTLRFQINDLKAREALGVIGAFSGIGAYIYLLSHLGLLWNEPALYQEAEEIVQLLPELIDQDQIFDIVGGAAGCIAALLSLYAVRPSAAILSTAVRCGDHIIKHARSMEKGLGWSIRGNMEPLTGFSHGAAGIAWSLLRLYALTKEDRFRQAALAAMEYERSLFSAEQRNWPDLRGVVQTEQPLYMVAWCHGAAGITLARLDSLAVVDNASMREEIAAGLQTTLTYGFEASHSLCHGALGNLEVVSRAAQVLQDPHYQERAASLSAMILESIERQGWITGIPRGVETPGLMVGLAGIGYGLLRLAFPEQIPSVLLLNPPRPSEEKASL